MTLHCNTLHLHYPGFALTLDLRLQAPVTLVSGPSGAGKTLLLRCLAGLEKPVSGELWVNGQCWFSPQHGLPPHQRPVCYAFQDYRLFPHRSVLQNLCASGASPTQAQALAEQRQLTHLLNRYPRHLSGGEKQRVALLRALLRAAVLQAQGSPPLLLLDEPLSALSAEQRQDWRQFLLDFVQPLNGQLLYVSHHLENEHPWPIATHLVLPGPGLPGQVSQVTYP